MANFKRLHVLLDYVTTPQTLQPLGKQRVSIDPLIGSMVGYDMASCPSYTFTYASQLLHDKTDIVTRFGHLLLLRAPLAVGWHAADAGKPRLSGPHPKRNSPNSRPFGKFFVRSRMDTA